MCWSTPLFSALRKRRLGRPAIHCHTSPLLSVHYIVDYNIDINIIHTLEMISPSFWNDTITGCFLQHVVVHSHYEPMSRLHYTVVLEYKNQRYSSSLITWHTEYLANHRSQSNRHLLLQRVRPNSTAYIGHVLVSLVDFPIVHKLFVHYLVAIKVLGSLVGLLLSYNISGMLFASLLGPNQWSRSNASG